MSASRTLLWIALAAALLLPCACREGKDQDEGTKSPSPATTPSPGVTLSAEALSLSGVRVARLEAAEVVGVRRAFGQVVDGAPLFAAAAAAAGRRAELEAARAALTASRAEYERVSKLHGEGENASLKALQAAEAAFRGDGSRVAAAQAQLEAGWSEVRQAWGPVITSWLEKGAGELEALGAQRERLVLVTLVGAEVAAKAPAEVAVRVNDHRVTARLVSPAPRTDPALQGQAFFYRAPSGGALVAGLNVSIEVPEGSPRHGVMVPAGAVVRWSGVRWVYRQAAAGHFERVELGDAQEATGGLFVTAGLAPGDEVAVAGAAVLLSQELTNLGLTAPGGED